ncbi:MAG TPA: LemA family protein [Gemmatimonadaceae bacterium]|nr:LemA family protein [Gemmatimonadaceae bacterium]
MGALLLGVIVVVVLVVVLVLSVIIGSYNGLVRRRNRVDNAWSQVDVQLKRRHDLVPNLVATVQGYATHERQTFQAVTDARAKAMSAQGPAEKSAAEASLTGAVQGLVLVAEAYPDLKASQNFKSLQDELGDVENRIAYARQFYNDAVMGYNTATETFPRSLIAGVFGFSPRQFFEAAAGDRDAVAVKFN